MSLKYSLSFKKSKIMIKIPHQTKTLELSWKKLFFLFFPFLTQATTLELKKAKITFFMTTFWQQPVKVSWNKRENIFAFNQCLYYRSGHWIKNNWCKFEVVWNPWKIEGKFSLCTFDVKIYTKRSEKFIYRGKNCQRFLTSLI